MEEMKIFENEGFESIQIAEVNGKLGLLERM